MTTNLGPASSGVLLFWGAASVPACANELPVMRGLPKISGMPRAAFIDLCLPSPADKPPSGANWIHEIKHDGYRLMARRDPVGIRLITRTGNECCGGRPAVSREG
jgi:ATP-dependent DNA ligase